MTVKFINGESLIPLNEMRRKVTQMQIAAHEKALIDLHHAIEEALAHQIEALGIDYKNPAFNMKDMTGKYSARFKRVVYDDGGRVTVKPTVAEEYYFDDKLLVRVLKQIIDQDQSGQGKIAFNIQVPKYGECPSPEGHG